MRSTEQTPEQQDRVLRGRGLAEQVAVHHHDRVTAQHESARGGTQAPGDRARLGGGQAARVGVRRLMREARFVDFRRCDLEGHPGARQEIAPAGRGAGQHERGGVICEHAPGVPRHHVRVKRRTGVCAAPRPVGARVGLRMRPRTTRQGCCGFAQQVGSDTLFPDATGDGCESTGRAGKVRHSALCRRRDSRVAARHGLCQRHHAEGFGV